MKRDAMVTLCFLNNLPITADYREKVRTHVKLLLIDLVDNPKAVHALTEILGLGDYHGTNQYQKLIKKLNSTIFNTELKR